MSPSRPVRRANKHVPPADRRLDALRAAHGSSARGPTPRAEDYVEVIYELIQVKGYARITDIGAHLHVSSPTVTRMIQRLDEEGLVVYERYRGVVLTGHGTRLAKEVRHRHGVVAGLLELLGVDAATAHRDTEGIEHHLDPQSLRRIAEFLAYAAQHPGWWAEFRPRRS